MSKIKKLLSDTIIYGFTTVITRMIGFIMTPIYTRSFTDSAVYGVFTNMYAYAALVNAILAFGMETTFFRFLNRVEEKEKPKVYDTSFTIVLFTSVLFLITIFLFANPIASWLSSGSNISSQQDYVKFVKYFGIILVADALTVMPFAKLRTQGKAKRYSFVKVMNILVLVLANLFFLFWLPSLVNTSSFWADFAATWFIQDWVGNVFIANMIASIVTVVLLLPQLLQLRFNVDKSLVKSMVIYSLPILIANISFIINEHLDKMMFPKLIPGDVGARDLGVYGAAGKLAMFLNLFITAFRLGVEPFFFSHAKEKNATKTYAMIMDYFIIIMVLVMVGICANLDWLKLFIAGDEDNVGEYWDGLYIVPVLLFNYVLLGIYMNLSIWYKLSDQTRYAIYISGLGAIVTIVFNFLFIPKYSYLGASLSTTLAYIVMVALSFIWGQKNYPIPYKVLKNLSYVLIGVLLSGLIYYVLEANFWLSNLLFLAFLVGVIFKEKNNVLKFVKAGK